MDINYWDSLFKKREHILPHEKFLEENLDILKGDIIDLASGDGRNTIFLANNNYKVTAIDFSNVALDKIKNYNNDNISTLKLNLDNLEELYKLPLCNSILINHYTPSKNLLLTLEKLLPKDGIIIMVGFSDSKEKYPLIIEEVTSTLKYMSVFKAETFSNSWGKFNGLILKKL